MPEEEDMVSLKKKKKKSRNQYLGYLFLGVCAPLQWHRNEVTAMNTCIEELGYVM